VKAWSYSSLKAFRTCAKQYYEIRVAKNFTVPENTEATLYGKSFHTAAEEYIRDGTELPLHFSFCKTHLDTLKNIPGDKLCEYKMALTEKLEPCDFFDPLAWCRGVADLLVINEAAGVARVVDYKTGKSAKYADPAQLELMALMIFKHFPAIKKVKGGLLFVIANDFKKAEYRADDQHIHWREWMNDVKRLEAAHATGVWNPTKSGLCKKHCAVTTCPHNGVNS
jgi:PD-(D/E)XK nuclease superfamily